MFSFEEGVLSMDKKSFDLASQNAKPAFKRKQQYAVPKLSLKDERDLGSELANLEIEPLPGSDFSASKAKVPRFWDGIKKDLHS